MRKRRAHAKNKATERLSRVPEIPKDLTAAIRRCWPRGVVEEFPVDESYFHEIRHQIERDLATISGASLVWQTEERVANGWHNDDDADEPLFFDSEWQSYHVYFLSPTGNEFRFEDETAGEDPENGSEAKYRGEGRFGMALAISLAAPFAVIDVSSHSWFEDGSFTLPDPICSLFWDDESGQAISTDEYYRDAFSQEAFKKLENLRKELVSVMASHRVSVLEQPLLNIPVKGLRADPDVFLEKPLCVRDVFFFRGA